MHIREQIQELKSAAMAVPLPEGYAEKQDLIEQAATLEFELSEYDAAVTRVLAIAKIHQRELEARRADLLRKRDSDLPVSFSDYKALERGGLDRPVPDAAAMLEASRHADLRQRLDLWIRELQAAGLLTLAEARACNPQIATSPRAVAKMREEAAAHQRLIDARDSILKTIADPLDRRLALEQYNLIDAPLSEGKLNDWLQRCVSARLLPIEWLAGRKLGGALHKILHGEVSNG